MKTKQRYRLLFEKYCNQYSICFIDFKQLLKKLDPFLKDNDVTMEDIIQAAGELSPLK